MLSLQKVDGFDQHGRKLTNVSELVLTQAVKPHTKKITCLDIDAKSEILASAVGLIFSLFIFVFVRYLVLFLPNGCFALLKNSLRAQCSNSELILSVS